MLESVVVDESIRDSSRCRVAHNSFPTAAAARSRPATGLTSLWKCDCRIVREMAAVAVRNIANTCSSRCRVRFSVRTAVDLDDVDTEKKESFRDPRTMTLGDSLSITMVSKYEQYVQLKNNNIKRTIHNYCNR